MDKIINLKFIGKDAKTLIKRHGGFSFFSDETENEIVQALNDNKQYSNKDILLIMAIIGVKNFDIFDMKALCKSFDCTEKEAEDYLDHRVIDNKFYPIKMSQEYAKKKVSELKELFKITYPMEKVRIQETLNRFNLWLTKKRIKIVEK